MKSKPEIQIYSIAIIAMAFFSVISCQNEASNTKDATTNYAEKVPDELGSSRSAMVFAPRDYDRNQAYPLAIMLHGYGANGLAQDVVFQLRKRVETYGLLLIIPQGTRNSNGLQFWNATDQCCNFDDQNVDDVAYLTSLIEEAKRTMHVDDARVSLIGHSNGGYMSYRFACERPDLVKRVVSLAGAPWVDPSRCTAGEPIDLLHIHGTLDTIVPFEERLEGSVQAAGVDEIEAVGAVATVDRWRKRANCEETPDITENIDLSEDLSGAETKRSRWNRCDSGNVVEYWEVVGGDHLLLDANDDFRERIATFVTEVRP